MRKGFTLIELMVVIVVIGVIAAFAIPGMNTSGKKFSTNYRNIADNINLARQKAIATNAAVTINFVSTETSLMIIENDGSIDDTFNFYSGIKLKAKSSGSGITSLDFNPGGTPSNDAVIEVNGFGKIDTIIVTLSGYILSR